MIWWSLIYHNRYAFIFLAEKEIHIFEDGFFYIANLVQKLTEFCGEDHVLRWMSPLLAGKLLIHAHHNWAVEQALLLRKHK
ncbi:Mutator mutT protein (7,8-dihydro-8-oxoguanine-triphosphatase) [Bacillus thuringiensis serovar israelensis ATCC 35646]|nr:Mutator mutT protein (7,8-dihydro-8-oxoguanine-triphosphatase) [Bacillus thuringiensis serovar israelensis ATCC 35646]